MPSGWTRWLFEQYEFPFQVVYPPTLDAGDLKSKFDVLVFTDGAIRRGGRGRGGGGAAAGRRRPTPRASPQEYRGWLGRITDDKTDSAAQEVRGGGRLRGDHRKLDQRGRSCSAFR